MKQKGMTSDHDICYFILLFSSLLKKEVSEKENEVAKIVIKSHTFLFHHFKLTYFKVHLVSIEGWISNQNALSKWLFFQYCNSNILFSELLPKKLSLFKL